MKKVFAINTLTALVFAWMAGVAVAAEPAAPASAVPDPGQLGYFFGFSFGTMMRQQTDAKVDLDQMRKGIEDAMAGREAALSREEQQHLVAMIQGRQKELRQAQLRETERAATAWLADNARKDGVKVTASGLQYQVIAEGKGAHPTPEDQVSVQYAGQTVDGREFDSSYKRGEPAEFGLGQVIDGWTEGLQLMTPGSKYRFYIPPALAYGSGGVPRAGIPPNAVLIFDVELLAIKPRPAPATQ